MVNRDKRSSKVVKKEGLRHPTLSLYLALGLIVSLLIAILVVAILILANEDKTDTDTKTEIISPAEVAELDQLSTVSSDTALSTKVEESSSESSLIDAVEPPNVGRPPIDWLDGNQATQLTPTAFNQSIISLITKEENFATYLNLFCTERSKIDFVSLQSFEINWNNFALQLESIDLRNSPILQNFNQTTVLLIRENLFDWQTAQYRPYQNILLSSGYDDQAVLLFDTIRQYLDTACLELSTSLS